ncbi:insulin receptor substrate 1 [Exaiptasia diaphana]|uniref:PH domain-containing protein n=1 Tax=Exaiptasia diaphana TaxID=2652724 RepID=A0A913X2F2_EXADI|nr:insulin receptor substrate 1 [Exaiptasia diaphana]
MATYEDLVKCGYLEMKLPRKQRKMTQKVWKRKWFVLRRRSKYGQTRLEYYHSEKACIDNRHKTIIPLCGVRNIDNVHSRTHQHAFQIAAPEIRIFLSGDNRLDTDEWVRLMKELVLPEPKMFPSVEGGDIFVTNSRPEDKDS